MDTHVQLVTMFGAVGSSFQSMCVRARLCERDARVVDAVAFGEENARTGKRRITKM